MEAAMTTSQPYHIPALLNQSLEALDLRPEGVYVDCTPVSYTHLTLPTKRRV